MVNTKGKNITVFLNDGLPKGVREVTIDQWSGRAICGHEIRFMKS